MHPLRYHPVWRAVSDREFGMQAFRQDGRLVAGRTLAVGQPDRHPRLVVPIAGNPCAARMAAEP